MAAKCGVSISFLSMPSKRISDIDAEFEFERKIAATQKSAVWLCHRRSNTERVVVKEIFLNQISQFQQLVDHVWNEKECMEIFGEFPRSPSLLGTSKSEKSLFFVMELINGAPLHLHCPINPDSARFYFAQTLSILEHIHSQSVVYRDVKLSNFILAHGKIFMCDFGHAKKISARTRSVCGTPHAMAPEVFGSEGYGFEVDFWGLGVMLYELMEGRPPFGKAPSVADMHAKLSFSNPTSAGSSLVLALLHPDPANRLCSFEVIRAHAFFLDCPPAWWAEAHHSAPFDRTIIDDVGKKFIDGDTEDF